MLAPDRAPSLDACYRHCGEVARAHSKTFYLSSLCLPPAKRRAVWAVYAFCRGADDIADRAGAAADRAAELDAWEARVRDAYAGRTDAPAFIALADAVARFGIPLAPALDLLRGVRSDVDPPRYATFAELERYCDLVASTVGLLVLPVLGAVAPDARPHAVALGRAMQLTNIVRDVGEDARMGRVYLPDEDLERFGCSRASLVHGVPDERFRALIRFEIARVRALYREAEPGVALLALDARYCVRLALSLYRGILDRIEANAYDVLTRRAFVPLPAKALSAVSLLFGAR